MFEAHMQNASRVWVVLDRAKPGGHIWHDTPVSWAADRTASKIDRQSHDRAKAHWLAGRLNECDLSIQAIKASHPTRRGKARAVRRFAAELLREYQP